MLVAQSAEQLFPTPEGLSSNSDNGNFIQHLFTVKIDKYSKRDRE